MSETSPTADKKNPALGGVKRSTEQRSDKTIDMNHIQNPSQVQGHPASVDAYIRHGWKLVPIPHGTKGPQHAAWNKPEAALKRSNDLPPEFGIGLAHAYSGTMALDVDDWAEADRLLLEHGISIRALYDAPDAVTIESGRPGRGKLLYRMPFGLTLPSRKITSRTTEGVNQVSYELRCATTNGLTVQDVLPPSIHPETQQPYRWGGKGKWDHLPEIPPNLLTFWQSLIECDSARAIPADGQVDASWNDIREALIHLSPDCSRDEWVTVGMALHWAGSHTDRLDQAMTLWDEWSSQSAQKYKGPRDIAHQWRSFKPDGGTTLGSLFHLAQSYGWQRPVPDASELFGTVGKDVSEPVDVATSLRPPAPDINMDLWPDLLATRAAEIADHIGCDPIVPLFAGMSAACGAVDSRTRLELMPGFKVPPVLWMMTIGEPADKKSPGSRPMFEVLKELEREDRPRFKQDMLNWEGQEAAYKAAKDNFMDYAASPDIHLDNDAIPTVPDLPAPPVPLKITVSDITSQKLVRSASERPMGILCYLDEMNSWVRKLTDRHSGEDRSTWVVSYESQAYEMDRVGAGSIWCENLAVSIYGNIQPRVFREHLPKMADDGLLQRFIPGILRHDKTKLGNPTPEMFTHKDQWDQLIRKLHAVGEQTYTMSHAAYEEYRAFQEWYEQAKRDERLLSAHDGYMTAFGKLEGQAGRLILMFHMINDCHNPQIQPQTVRQVVDVVKDYLIPALRYALGEVGGLVDDSLEMWVSSHIIHLAGEVQTISLRDLRHSARRRVANLSKWERDQALRDAMMTLELCKWVSLVEDNPRTGHTVWAINPALSEAFKEQREAVIRAKQRRLDNNRAVAMKSGGYIERRVVKGYQSGPGSS